MLSPTPLPTEVLDRPRHDVATMPTWLMLLIAAACGLIVANLYYVQPLVGPIRADIGLPAGASEQAMP